MTKMIGVGSGNNPASKKGHSNITPISELPLEKQREIKKKGCEASIKARAKKKEAKTLLNAINSVDLKDSDLISSTIKKYCEYCDIPCTARNVMNVAMVLGSLNGTKDGDPNPACYKAFMDYNIGPPIQRTEVQIVDDSKVNNVKKKLRDNPELVEELFGDEDE